MSLISVALGFTPFATEIALGMHLSQQNGANAPGGTIRYAPYVESMHSSFLNSAALYRTNISDWENSPYKNHKDLDYDGVFFGVGYMLSSFPSLYDMFGKFMAGFDVDSLFSTIFGESLELPEVKSLTNAQVAQKDDDILTDIIPQFVLAMRDLNTVVSSSFVIGKALLEERRVRLVNEISSDLRYFLIPSATRRWIDSLNFQKKVVVIQAFLLKLYTQVRLEIDRSNYRTHLRHALWPFTVMGYERIALAALRGTTGGMADTIRKRSQMSKGFLIASYVATGAYVGSSWGPYGTLIGGAVGLVVGIAIVMLE